MEREWKVQQDRHGYFAALINRTNGESIIRSQSYPERGNAEKDVRVMSVAMPGNSPDNGDGGD